MPMRGIKVVEACSNIAGPVTGTIFGDLGAEEGEVHHDDVFGGLHLVPHERRGWSVLFRPVDNLEQGFAHHAVVLAGEVDALLDLGAVDLDEPFAGYLVGELGNVIVGEATLPRNSSSLPISEILQNMSLRLPATVISSTG